MGLGSHGRDSWLSIKDRSSPSELWSRYRELVFQAGIALPSLLIMRQAQVTEVWMKECGQKGWSLLQRSPGCTSLPLHRGPG